MKVTHSVEEPIRDPNSINLRMQNHLHSSGRRLGRMHANPARVRAAGFRGTRFKDTAKTNPTVQKHLYSGLRHWNKVLGILSHLASTVRLF